MCSFRAFGRGQRDGRSSKIGSQGRQCPSGILFRSGQHVHDGTTVEYTYAPGETRHETYGPGEFKVHDLENLGDKEMVFMTIEFLQSANKPLPLPSQIRGQAAA